MAISDELLVIQERCSVTMFDMKVELNRDGRERGLWIFLDDQSPERDATYNKWIDGAIEVFVQMMGYKDTPKENLQKFSAYLSLDGELRRLAGGKVRHGVLLEWPAIEKFHAAMGKAIKAGKLAAKKREKEYEQCLTTKKTTSTRASSSSTSKRKGKRKTNATRRRARNTSTPLPTT